MADVFENRLQGSVKGLSSRSDRQMDVPAERQFLGFDAYKKAIDCLKPGDVAILAAPPAFRWVHFAYAIEKGVHVFMEKPVTVDGPTTRRMIELGKKADEKNLKVGVGLMVRHCRGRQELLKRIRDGQIGEIIALRAYRMAQRSATCAPPQGMSEVLFQIARFHSFLWASGGLFSDYFIHQIDECSWVKGAWPVKAHALGGRHYRGEDLDQNFDTYSVEFTYPDGTKPSTTAGPCRAAKRVRQLRPRRQGLRDHLHLRPHARQGTPLQGPDLREGERNLGLPQPEPNPYQLEWDDLVDAIRNDKPYNEVEPQAIASMVTSMGRMAAHTGNEVTYEEMLACKHEFAPDVDKLTEDGPAPVQLKDGKYPVPMPGIITAREY